MRQQFTKLLIMDLISEYEDVLQSIEATVVGIYRQNPSLKDTEVLKAYDLAIKYYQRKKKKMPAMDYSLSGNTAIVYYAVMKVCEWRLERGPGEKAPPAMEGMEGLGGNVPIVILIRCLEKLHLSVERWHKKDGVRGYLNFISQYV